MCPITLLPRVPFGQGQCLILAFSPASASPISWNLVGAQYLLNEPEELASLGASISSSS